MEPSGLYEQSLVIAKMFHPRKLKRLFHRPVIIVSAPRCGSNLLFEQLAKRRGLWTLGGESHAELMAFVHLRAENPQLDSGRLLEGHADVATREVLRAAFVNRLQDSQGTRFLDIAPSRRPLQIRFLEKTPRNALNIPFLLKVFPDARFVFLYRDARQNVASLVEAWREGERNDRFVTYNFLPGWQRGKWCFLLPPGWRTLNGKSLIEICAFQWSACNRIILEDLAKLPKERWTSLSYQNLITDPQREITRLCSFSGLKSDPQENPISDELALSKTTLSPPDPNKWRYHEKELEQVASVLEEVTRMIEAHCGRPGNL